MSQRYQITFDHLKSENIERQRRHCNLEKFSNILEIPCRRAAPLETTFSQPYSGLTLSQRRIRLNNSSRMVANFSKAYPKYTAVNTHAPRLYPLDPFVINLLQRSDSVSFSKTPTPSTLPSKCSSMLRIRATLPLPGSLEIDLLNSARQMAALQDIALKFPTIPVFLMMYVPMICKKGPN